MTTATKTKRPAHSNGRDNGHAARPISPAGRDMAPDVAPGELSHFASLPIDSISRSPHNPRGAIDAAAPEFVELMLSVAAHGVLEPILVRTKKGDGRYELIAGERRWRAAEAAGLTHVPAVVRDASDAQALVLQLVENLQRADLDPIAEAKGFHRATQPIAKGGAGLTQTELAVQLGKSQAYVSNAIRLLDLPPLWIDRIISREISVSHGKELLAWKDQPKILKELDRYLSQGDEFDAGTLASFRAALNDCVREASFPITGRTYVGGKDVEYAIDADESTVAKLELVECATWNGEKVMRALNGKLAEKLMAQARDAAIDAAGAKEKKGNRQGAKAAKGEAAKELTPAEKRERTKELAEQHAKRLALWELRWLRDLAALELPLAAAKKEGAAVLARASLWMLSQPVVRYVHAIDVEDACGKATCVTKGARRSKTCWQMIAAADAGQALAHALAAGLANIDGKRFQEDCERSRADLLALVRGLAGDLGIDLALAWRNDEKRRRSFLELHDKDQLAELAKKWKQHINVEQTRSQIINGLMAPEKHLPLPKELQS